VSGSGEGVATESGGNRGADRSGVRDEDSGCAGDNDNVSLDGAVHDVIVSALLLSITLPSESHVVDVVVVLVVVVNGTSLVPVPLLLLLVARLLWLDGLASVPINHSTTVGFCIRSICANFSVMESMFSSHRRIFSDCNLSLVSVCCAISEVSAAACIAFSNTCVLVRSSFVPLADDRLEDDGSRESGCVVVVVVVVGIVVGIVGMGCADFNPSLIMYY